MDIFKMWNAELYPDVEKTDVQGMQLPHHQENEDALANIGIDSEAEEQGNERAASPPDYVSHFRVFFLRASADCIQPCPLTSPMPEISQRRTKKQMVEKLAVENRTNLLRRKKNPKQPRGNGLRVKVKRRRKILKRLHLQRKTFVHAKPKLVTNY